MRGELSPPRPTPSRPVGGEMVLSRVPNSGRNVFAGHAGLHAAGQCEVGMVEGVEHLHIEAQRGLLPDGKTAREVDVGVGEVRAAHGVAACSRQTGSWRGGIAACAGAGGGIDDRDEGVGIEPLPGSGNGDAGDTGFFDRAARRERGGQTAGRRPERRRCRLPCKAG